MIKTSVLIDDRPSSFRFPRGSGSRQNIEKQHSSLEVGKNATLIIVDGHIMDIRSNVIRAFIDGRDIDLSDHHKMLDHKYRLKYKQSD